MEVLVKETAASTIPFKGNIQLLIEQSTDGIAVISPEGRLSYISPSVKKILGYSTYEVMRIGWFNLIHPEDALSLPDGKELVCATPGIPIKGNIRRMRHKDGTWRWIEATITNMLHDPEINGIVNNFHDITEKKESNQKLINANRLYAFISAINQTIVHIKDEETVFKEACRIATEVGKFKAAWIGVLDATNQKINLTNESGMLPGDTTLLTNVSYSSKSIQQQALSANSHYVFNDIQNGPGTAELKTFASFRGYNSCIVLPIRKSGSIVATFNLYSSEINFFNIEEITLLEEAAGDISFALNVFEKEKLRTEAEQKLRHSELRLNHAQEIAHLGSWELDFSTGLAQWSVEQCKIYGVPPTDNMHSYESWLSFIHPEDFDRVLKESKEGQESFKDFTIYHRIIRRDGTVRYLYNQNHFEFNEEHLPIGLYGASHDITEIKETEQKLINANRLYSFTSHINQAIVHANDEQALFNEVCRIAVDIGKFELSWIAEVDEPNGQIDLIAENNATDSDLRILGNWKYEENGPIANVLRSGTCHFINDFDSEPETSKARKFALSRGFKSVMTLPITKSGKIVLVINLFSSKKQMFNAEEILLLEESIGEISFALDAFEKDKQKVQAERKLIHSELRLKQSQAISHLGSWEFDIDTNVITWSEEGMKIYGLFPEERVQPFEAWFSYIHPDDLEMVTRITSDAQISLESTAFFHRIIRKDGTIRHIHAQSQFEFNDEGMPIGVYGISLDVTEMKETEIALRQSQANLRLIIDLIPQPIFKKDYDGRFIYTNKSFSSLYGLEPDQLVGKTIAETIPGKNKHEYFLQQDRDVINNGKTKVFPELPFTDHTGKERIFHTTKVPYSVPGIHGKAVLSISLDITEQKQAEAERNKMIADIVQRNKDLEQFSYIISHNLRAPVANILGLTNLIQNLEYTEEEEAIVMDGLLISAQKMDGVIRDINYVLQAKQNMSEQKEPIKCSHVLNDIKVSISDLIRNEEVEIISDFTAVDTLLTIKSYWHSILFNLISNSIKYRQPGIKPIIEISSRKENNITTYIFSDNGLGIDLHKKGDEVFGLYKRFHSHTEGKGMGLYMVKTQVEALGGKITIDSEVNKGTTFTIVFENN